MLESSKDTVYAQYRAPIKAAIVPRSTVDLKTGSDL